MNFYQWIRGASVFCERKAQIMAEKMNRLSANIAGKYYVDSSCIDCDMCRITAPQFFQRDDEIGLSFVYCQPKTLEDLSLAEQARQDCPTESIGSDGG